jgi:hypothetical protein
MPAHEVYMLHIYHSRAVSGRQWTARLEHLPGGEQVRFTDPKALLAYLATVMLAEDPSATSREPPAGDDAAGTDPRDTQKEGAGEEG